MCTPECYRFATSALGADDIEGKAVLEVGARDFNGSLRGPIEALGPASYVAVDMIAGPGVDAVCNAEDLISRFGRDSFDVVISTEMLEHVRHWRAVVSNLKGVTRPGGIILLTTRSKGFPFHGCPGDFWRFEVGDVKAIFADTAIERLETDDAAAPGVFLKARKPAQFAEVDMAGYRLYSIIRRRRIVDAGPLDIAGMVVVAAGWKATKAWMPKPVINAIRRRAWHTA